MRGYQDNAPLDNCLQDDCPRQFPQTIAPVGQFPLGQIPAVISLKDNCPRSKLVGKSWSCRGRGELSRARGGSIANFHGHALSALTLMNKSTKKSITTVNVREFPEFGELQLCVIANR